MEFRANAPMAMDFVDMPEVHDRTQGKLNQMLVVVDKFTILIPTKKEENTEGILRLIRNKSFAIPARGPLGNGVVSVYFPNLFKGLRSQVAEDRK
jgi:hypothetical protein